MSEADDVLEWLRELSAEATLSASVLERLHLSHEALRNEINHVRSLVSRAIEWRIATVLIERAPEGADLADAKRRLDVSASELGYAIDALLDMTLGTIKQPKE